MYLRFLGASLWRPLANLFSVGRPTGLGYLAAFLYGSATSFRYRIDRKARLYVAR